MFIAISLLAILSFLLLLLLCLIISFLWTTIVGGIPYLATDKKRVKEIVTMAKIQKGEKAIDLGSGDGRLVIAMAQKGAEAHGYELNILYILISKWNIRKNHLQGKAFIHWQNFFKVNLSQYDIVTCFGIPYMMNKIEKKLQKELKPKARVVITSFPFTHWKNSDEKDFVFLYKKTAVSGK